MKVINAGYELINEPSITKKIERVARVCYKSEDKIDEGTDITMCHSLIQRNHCYDTETEILTLHGWKKYNELTNNDLFATLNDKGFVEYLPSNGYTCYEYSGKMIQVNTHSVNLLVTDKHKMYVCKTTTKEGRKKEKYELIEADTLLDTSHAYLKNSKGYVNNGSNIPLDILKLLGFAIGDGTVSHSLSFHLFKERKVRYLTAICNNLNIHVTTSKDDKGYDRISIGLSQPGLSNYSYLFKDIYNSKKEKKIPYTLLQTMNKNECKALLDGLLNSDGHTTKDNSSYYSTTSEELKGQFQQLCLHCGYSSNETDITELKDKANFNSNKILSKMSVIKRENTPEINKGKNTKGTIKEINNWQGIVWCVNIPPYHNVYVRRNGKPVWCGNCAMLEHGNLVLEVGEQEYSLIETIRSFMENMVDKGDENKKCFLRYTNCADESKNYSVSNLHYVVSGNIRAWYEFMQYANSVNALPVQLYNLVNDAVNNIFDIDVTEFDSIIFDMYEQYDFYAKVITDMSTLSDEERMIHETFSVLFTSDLLIQRELVRHREASFAGESTRYCNYSLDKFGNEITVIKPCFWNEESTIYKEWKMAMADSEIHYFELIKLGASPQEARDALPVATKCDTVVTTNLSEWKHIFNLRACDSTGPAHPKMKEIMIPLFKEMREKYPFAFGDMVAADEIL